jgi:RHS repeat-associated protein
VYDSYGVVAFKDSAWSDQEGDEYAQQRLFQGMLFHSDIGWYFAGQSNYARWYSPTLMVWNRPDDAGFVDGPSREAFVGNNPIIFLDPNGTNQIFISGGVTDNPDRDKHDFNWKNFITSAQIQIETTRAFLEAGETVEWLIFKPGYEAREIADNKVGQYITEIEAWARAHDVQIRYFTTTAEFVESINTNLKAEPRNGKEKITQLYNYSHGLASSWNFDFYTGNKVRFGIQDIKRLDPSAFASKSKAVSWACNTATPDGSNKTFTAAWRSHLGHTMAGVIGKTDYGPTAGVPAPKSYRVRYYVAGFLGIGIPFHIVPAPPGSPPSGPVLSPGSRFSVY